jgi:hypothetical protein
VRINYRGIALALFGAMFCRLERRGSIEIGFDQIISTAPARSGCGPSPT